MFTILFTAFSRRLCFSCIFLAEQPSGRVYFGCPAAGGQGRREPEVVQMRFTKMHGIGNDYLYVSLFDERVENPSALAAAKTRLFDRCFMPPW